MMSHQQRDERIRTIKRQRGLLGTDLAQAKELACAMHGAWLGNNPWRGKDQRDPDYVAWRASRKDPRFGSYERATSLVSTLQRQIEALTQELAALQQAARKQQQARPEPNKRKEPSMPDFHLPDTRPMPGSPVARVQLNLTAIRTLRALEQSGRLPKPAELDALAAYVGWGACPQIFAGLTPEWQQYQQQLRALLSPAEYEHAQRSTTNAHYTSALVVKAIWRALERLGMQPGMNWLEPALGVGNFFGLQPARLRGGRRIGVEKDTITGRIAQLLYPDSTVLIQPFEEAPLPENYFDAAISNVPFGDYGVYDPAFSARRWLTKSIHNYFFVKALDLVRPGGVIAFITSRYTLDGYSPDADGVRSYLAQRAELLGAFRLPDSAFEECAGTSVVTDVIFLRKRLPNARPSEEKPPIWLEAKWQIYSSAGSYVNQYFCNGHGHCVLGTPMIQRGAYTKLDYTVRGLLTAEQLDRAFETLPTAAFLPYSETGTRRPRAKPVLELHAAAEKIGGLFVERTKLYRRISAASVERVDVTGPAFQRAVSQLEIRDQLVNLLDAEREDQPTGDLDRLRQELGRLYLRFVKRFGVLSKRVNQLAIAGDPDAPLLLSLEQEYDPKAGTAHPAPILSRRVLEPVRPVTRVGSAEEALAVSLNETARVDWDRMAALTGRSAAQLQADLAGLVFEDPKTGEWETADAYLSGSVRRKLAIAKARATVEPRFAVNVKALEAAQPEDIPPGEIVALLGVSWVPLDVYGQFIQVVMNSKEPAKVCYINGEYHFNDPWTSTASKWSTADVSAGELLRDCLNQRRTKVWRRDEERSWVDQEATMAAQERQGKLHEYFNEWLLATDPVRTDAMARIYNERVNDLRLRSYDGSHLTLPGMSRACLRTGDMEPYQKAAVWRQICQTKCYIAHAVGAGKTFEAIAGAMELRRLGLIRRPMFVVPNSTLSGWQNQFQLLYPGARVIVFSERDLESSKRKATMARIATTEWDAVVVPHSSFQLIPVGPEVFQRHYNRLEQQLEESVKEAQAEGMDSRFVKRLVKQKERLLKRLLERQGKHKDNTVSWEQLAIDHLVVDECFPADTLIETEHGMVPIQKLVANQSTVRVKSVNTATGEIEWKRISGWYTNPDKRPQVRVSHEYGELICTVDHKIWTEEDGYVPACLLSENHHLRVVPRGKAAKEEGGSNRDPLFAGVSKGTRRTRQANDEILRVVREAVHIRMVRAETGSNSPLLQPIMLGILENGSTWCNELSYPAADLEAAQAGAERSSAFRANEKKQPDAVSHGTRTDASENGRPHILSAGRERDNDETAKNAVCPSGPPNGIRHPNGTGSGTIPEPPELLPGGHSGPVEETRYRDRREDAPACTMDIPGSAQDGSAKRSRVVCVEIHKLPGDVGSGECGARDSRVYCLSVEDNHNFFANGVLVSNCHEYKRLGFTTKQGAVAGIDPDGNQKTFDLLMKVRYTEEHDGRIVFLSGTPATNTMGELYNAMQYLIQPELDARGLGRFDEWSAAFGQVINVFEPKPEGGGYQVKGRFARFINVPELSQLFRSFADVVTSDMLDIPRSGIAGGERQGVVNTLNPAQRIYMKKLQERAAEIRKNARAALPDCMIAIYGDAQMMALDVRMVDPSAPDHPDSRINQCAREILRQYRQSSRDRGTQLVFCDFGKPRAEQQKSKTVRRRFSAYDDLIAKLVAAGIPREQIAHIYQARNKHERSRLFRWVNAGQIRVLIGSTAKMGLGVNVQERVVAMHHLTLPHRPADLEQREGRGLRQGNRNASVAVFYYITKGSLDELKFANVARKARAFAQFMQGKSTVREMEDIDELTPSLETFQAAASGDPRVRRKLEVDNELHRLGVLQNEFRTERWKKRSALNDIPHRIEVAEKQIAALRKLAEAWDSREREWTIYDQQFTGDGIQRRAGQALENAIRRLPGHDTIAHPVGTVNGIRIFATSTRWFAFEGVAEWINVKDMAGSGMIQSAEYFLRHLDEKIVRQQERITRAQADRTELEASLAQPWDHEARYQALRKEQAALFTALGGGKDEAGAAVSAEGAEVAAPDVEAAEVPDPIEEESDEEESDDFAEPDWPADLPEPEAVFEAVQASLAAVLDEGTETLSLFDGSFETIEIQ